MNKNRRNKNRNTAEQLQIACEPPCPECGEKGRHWVGHPYTLADVMAGIEQQGFWTCDKFYGPDGRRIGE